MKIKWSKVFLIILFVLISSGFALLDTYNWQISKSDPTLWVKACTDLKNNTWTSNNISDTTDPLKSSSSVTYDQILTSVINDYNNVQEAYIRIAKYPDDPNNPGSPSAGDSTFTIAKGNVRTIEVCFADSVQTNSSGDSKRKTSGSDVTSCTIRIKSSLKSDLNFFISTFTHELGHCLGLDHPMDTTSAIMSYFKPDDKIRLLADDKMGLIHIFPEDSDGAKESNTFGLSCSRN